MVEIYDRKGNLTPEIIELYAARIHMLATDPTAPTANLSRLSKQLSSTLDKLQAEVGLSAVAEYDLLEKLDAPLHIRFSDDEEHRQLAEGGFPAFLHERLEDRCNKLLLDITPTIQRSR